MRVDSRATPRSDRRAGASTIIVGMANTRPHPGDSVRESYSARSQEYTDLCGSMASTHPSDRALVSSWVATLTGPVLDAGCDPGQWTGFLAKSGLSVTGIDPVPEFARVIRPGGGLLVGFFEGATVSAFDHAVTTAYRWPVAELGQQLAIAGFEVIETHTRTGHGYRPHGAISARRQGTR